MDTTELIAQLVEGLESGSLVTKFVIIAEAIGPAGDRAVWTDTHDGATRSDVYGLLMYALEQERGFHHLEIRDDE